MKKGLIVLLVMFSLLLLTSFSAKYISALSMKKNVVLYFGGIDKEEEILKLNVGDKIDFSNYEIDGLTLKVYDDKMNLLDDDYTVDDNVVLNLIYDGISIDNPENNKARVVILAGQSNAAGVGRYNCLKDTVPEEYLLKLENGFDNVLMCGYSHGHEYKEFRKVKLDNTDRSTDVPGTFGPEIFIAERLSEAFSNETVYIVKTAFGGCSLDYDFKSPSGSNPIYFTSETNEAGWLYDILIDSVNSAIEQIEDLGKTPSIEAFMWLQGESDATLNVLVDAYLEKFNALIYDFKNEFSDNISKSFVVCDAACYEGIGLMFPLAEDLNNVKKTRIDSNNIYIDVNAMGATTYYEPYNNADCAHYDATSYINISRAIADEYIKKINPLYETNTLEIEGDNKITVSLSKLKTYLNSVTVKYNGEIVEAEYYFESSDNKVINVKKDGRLIPQEVGEAKIKIIACYNETFQYKIIDVKVTE